MTDFIVYPAIDLREGKVVRLVQGNSKRATIYDEDPASVAHHWVEEGAQWIHVINLDGAFGVDTGINRLALESILKVTASRDVRIQFGGGIRRLDDLKEILDLGVARVIMGTSAVKNQKIITRALNLYDQDVIGVGIDVRDGQVQIQGWQETTLLTSLNLGLRVKEWGIKVVVFTNIARDGVGTGVDVSSTLALAEATGLHVIASGGVASISDIQRVKNAGLPGVIVGRALYEGDINLKEALAC